MNLDRDYFSFQIRVSLMFHSVQILETCSSKIEEHWEKLTQINGDIRTKVDVFLCVTQREIQVETIRQMIIY